MVHVLRRTGRTRRHDRLNQAQAVLSVRAVLEDAAAYRPAPGLLTLVRPDNTNSHWFPPRSLTVLQAAAGFAAMRRHPPPREQPWLTAWPPRFTVRRAMRSQPRGHCARRLSPSVRRMLG